MAEYIKRDDVISGLVKSEGTVYSFAELCLLAKTESMVKSMVTNIPAADVVEIVRCKDCKYYEAFDCLDIGTCCNEKIYISYYGECAILQPKPDFYCAYGERRAEND